MSSELPVRYPLRVYQAATKVLVCTWQADGAAVNLTGYAGTLGLWTPARVLLDTATAGDGASAEFGITLALGGSAGTVTATFPPGFAAAVAAYGPVLYDLILTAPGGVATALVAGSVVVELGRPAA